MCVYATPSSREASIKCCRARRVAARVAHKILWQPKRGTTTTFRIQQHLQMSRCALYPCICEIRRYTDSEDYATFTFCSSTVSVAIYATHKKLAERGVKRGTERGEERWRAEDTPQSALQRWLQAQLFSSGRAWRSAFAFNFSEKRCTFNARPMQGGVGAWQGTRSLLVVVMLFKVSLSCILAMAIKSGKRVRFLSPPIRFSLRFRFLAPLLRQI